MNKLCIALVCGVVGLYGLPAQAAKYSFKTITFEEGVGSLEFSPLYGLAWHEAGLVVTNPQFVTVEDGVLVVKAPASPFVHVSLERPDTRAFALQSFRIGGNDDIEVGLTQIVPPYAVHIENDGGVHTFALPDPTDLQRYGASLFFGSDRFDATPLGFTLDDIVIAVSNIPEPANWALMIAGFGLTGMALRRRAGLAAL